MTEYEKRKLLLDATLAIIKEKKINLHYQTDVSEAVALASNLLKEIEECIEIKEQHNL